MGGNGNSNYSVSFKNRDELLKFIDHMEKETGLKAEVMFHKYGETIKQRDVINLYLDVPDLPELIVKGGQEEQPENFYMENPAGFQSIHVVDSAGNIDCPILGKCHVVGLNDSQCKEMLKKQYLSLFKTMGYDFEDYSFLFVSMKNRFLDRNTILQYDKELMSKEYWGKSFSIRLTSDNK